MEINNSDTIGPWTPFTVKEKQVNNRKMMKNNNESGALARNRVLPPHYGDNSPMPEEQISLTSIECSDNTTTTPVGLQQQNNGGSKLITDNNHHKEYETAENWLNKDLNIDTIVDDESDTVCGLGPFTPDWLQFFASKQAFLVVFCITWVLQGMYYTYFVSVITTIEKLFQIQSKTTGLIMSATEIGQIGSSLLLTYYGGHGHRPKWIARGMVLFALSSFTCSLPHFIYGKQLIQANDRLFSGVASTVGSPYSNTTGNGSNEMKAPNICRSVVGTNKLIESTNETYFDLVMNELAASFYSTIKNESSKTAVTIDTSSNSNDCEDEFQHEHDIQTKVKTIVLAIFFVSLLGVGMGQTAVYTLGIPYIDDNVASRESPLYFAITIGVRILGPALGFMLGSLCTRLYADLTVDPPHINQTDPRWVGAWWLGLVLVSSLLMLASLAMFSFPKRLKKKRSPQSPLQQQTQSQLEIQETNSTGIKIATTSSKHPSLRDFPKAMKRLLKNDILMFRTASSVLHILPIAGIYTFLPKYFESQFRLPAHTANMISGVGGILVMGVGIVVSGFFILRRKPNAQFVAGWIAFTAVTYAFGMALLMLVGCPMDDFAGLHRHNNGITTFESTCTTANCQCDMEKFSPICGNDHKTYFSACHAGCRNVSIVDGKITEFFNCECLVPPSISTNSSYMYSNNNTTSSQLHLELLSINSNNNTYINKVNEQIIIGRATIGYCDFDCGNFWWYIILFSFFVFIHSTGEVGSILLILRCVDPRDKAMALGLIQFAIGLFGNVPCPIIYGAVVDSACLVWEMACGEKGACWLYDSDVFRMFYHGTTGAILLCAFFVDLIVWYKAGSINFVHDDDDDGGGGVGEAADVATPNNEYELEHNTIESNLNGNSV